MKDGAGHALAVAEDAADGEDGRADMAARAAELFEAPDVLLRASRLVSNLLESLRAGQDALQRVTLERLHSTNAKLTEISTATETAATDILDGVDRALLLVDRLEQTDAPAQGEELLAGLREELFGVMNYLQFQDITTQQIRYATSIIEDMKRDLQEFAGLLEPAASRRRQAAEEEEVVVVERADEPPRAYDPSATTLDAVSRQALVDELLGGESARVAAA